MKVAVFGFGTVNFHLDSLKIKELYGGEPPYGGAAAAAEFAAAGYETVLWDENLSAIPRELIEKVEDAGVKLTDDLYAAADADVAVLFTPFEKGKTAKVAEEILPHLGGDAVIASTYNVPPLILKAKLEKNILKSGRKDVGFSSLHPAALPGTPHHRQYLIATNELLREPIATEEQIERLKKLAEDKGKKAYPVAAELVSAFGDGSVAVSAAVFLGLLEFYKVSKEVLHIRKPQMEFQIAQSLTTVANIITKHGMEGLVKLLNLEAVRDSLKSMYFGGELQPITGTALHLLNNAGEFIPEGLRELPVEKDPAYLSIPTAAMVEYVLNMVGENMLKNITRDAMRKLHDDFERKNCPAEEEI